MENPSDPSSRALHNATLSRPPRINCRQSEMICQCASAYDQRTMIHSQNNSWRDLILITQPGDSSRSYDQNGERYQTGELRRQTAVLGDLHPKKRTALPPTRSKHAESYFTETPTTNLPPERTEGEKSLTTPSFNIQQQHRLLELYCDHYRRVDSQTSAPGRLARCC